MSSSVATRTIWSGIKNFASATFTAVDATIGQLHFDVGHDVKDTIFLAGSARSGTTWVAELIDYDKSYRLIFEPLFPRRVALCRAFLPKQYIRPQDDSPQFLEPAKKIVSGRFRNGWTDRFNHQPFPRRRLIKDVRANLMLSWLHVHFPEMPLVLLLRHPLAVVASLLRRGWSHNLDVYLDQKLLVEDFLAPYLDQIKGASNAFEAHLIGWCIETLVPLRQFKDGEIHIVFYENFRVEPRAEVTKLFHYLGKQVDERVFTAMEKPSKRTRLPSPKELGESAASVDDWRSQLSASQISTAHKILEMFDLDSLYRDDGLPNEHAVLASLRPHA